jgi:hypothetical protein
VADQAGAEQWQSYSNREQHSPTINRLEQMALLLQQHRQYEQASRLPSRQKIEIGLLRHRITGRHSDQLGIHTARETSLAQNKGIALMPIATQKTWIQIHDSKRTISSSHTRLSARD